MLTSSPRLPVVRQYMAIWAICGVALFSLPAKAFSPVPDGPSPDRPATVYFSINARSLRSALIDFSKQSGIQLIYVAAKQNLPHAIRLEGRYTVRQALKLLLHNSGLEYEFSEENTVTIRAIGKETGNNPHTNRTMTLPVKPDDTLPPGYGIEEIVSIGTRGKGRTALETPVPVDSFNTWNIAATGETETGRILQSLAPSFNFSSSSISDGTDAIKPATLRGLGPDQTLVLINGKRRHNSALVHVNTSVGRGATGVDMNAIPPGAIKRIEVLRDGASAQYGSDAIAGVINIILKNQNEGGDISTSFGQTYAGDGTTYVADATYGRTLATRGFLTLTAEYRNRQHTNRAGLSGCLQFATLGQKACAVGNIALDPREKSFNRKNFRVGDSDTRQKALVMNMMVPLSDFGEFYMFATYSNRDNQSAGFYRRANQYRRTVTALYPNGFLPLINAKILDYSVLAGTKWTMGNGWSLDSSLTTGGNSFQFLITNSLNASFGADSPTSADAGTLEIHQIMANIDFSKSFKNANIAFGAEWRRENYQIIAGDPVSYANGGQLNYTCPGCKANPVAYLPGFQVFKGFSPDNAVDKNRNNLAFYTDVEVKPSPDLLMNVAVRYEDYSDFGSRINAKFATRYQLDHIFALRGSISSGFRAPSMQQKFFNSTSTQFVEVNGVSIAQERGTFRNDSTVARALAIPKLKKETAVNYSFGFVITPLEKLSLTADYYRIDINNRIAITGSIPIKDKFPGVAAATGATDGQFFTNIANTETQGVDFVANYDLPMPTGQRLRISLAANKTKTRIKNGSVASPLPGVDRMVLFSPQDRSIIEQWQPAARINFTLDYGIGKWFVILRNNYYGSYVVCEGSCNIATGPGQNIQRFTPKILTDLQISYYFETARVRITVGANNIFNIFPDINRIGQSRAGSIAGIVASPGVFTYSRRSAPFGYNGGYYYLRLTKNF
ncbi:MAG: TonB-dependent receptor [Alphaproteobacteria bacterium]|nr:TonB-dependent receptor [Alphaproteobacteria bacterium]